MIKNIKGAIFDLDGTLLDSMGMWYSLYENYLKEANIVLTDELRDFFNHASIPMAAQRFSQGIIPRSAETIEKELYDYITDFYKNKVDIKANSDVFVHKLHEKGVKLCVATATERRHAEAALKRLGLLQYFDKIFSCKDLKIEKNKPDIYLTALEYLGTDIKETVVFEDACHAVKTAKAADFYVVAIEEETVAKKEQVKELADMYIIDYKDIIKEL